MVQVAKGFRLPMPRDCDKQLYQLMSKCWKHDPKKRPDTADILRVKLKDKEREHDLSHNHELGSDGA